MFDGWDISGVQHCVFFFLLILHDTLGSVWKYGTGLYPLFCFLFLHDTPGGKPGVREFRLLFCLF